MLTQKQTKLIDSLESQGFDTCTPGNYSGVVNVGCSQCEASVINGVACHETGCPNEVHECHGCNSYVPRGVKYCEDCR